MARGRSGNVTIRVAAPADWIAVSRVLDGALLEHPDLEERIADGAVLVATVDESVVGAAVVERSGSTGRSPPEPWPDSAHLEAIAVRRKRRRDGVGAALVQAARERWAPLTADFDERVEPFYESLSAECRAGANGRRWALLRDRPQDNEETQ